MTLFAGTPAPLFTAPAPQNPTFAFGSLGGLYVVLAFLPPPGPERDRAVALAQQHRSVFHQDRMVLFGVLPDEASYATAPNEWPWCWFSDVGGELRRMYDVAGPDGEVQPHWVVIDPTLRIMGSYPLDAGPALFQHLAQFGDPDDHAKVPVNAPVLIVPRILEPGLCQRLIAYYKAVGGEPSGVMRFKDGKTVAVLDEFKKRRDVYVADPALGEELRMRVIRRLVPEIRKAFQFVPTQMERYLIACYDAEEGGYFNAHRDNTTPGTAHRKFAVSINLNAEEFEGGDLRFPEFGRRTYRPPTGGAVVFSCSLLHEATPVLRGTRYAFLPFLYDQDGVQIRAANAHTVVVDQPAAAPEEEHAEEEVNRAVETQPDAG